MATKHSHSKNLARDTSLLAVGSILSKGLTFLLVPLLTYFLSPTEFGEYDLLTSYVVALLPLATLQLEQGIFRYVFDEPERSRFHFSVAMLFVAGVTCAVCAAVMIIGYHIYDYHILWPLTLYFSALILFTCSVEYLRGAGRLVSYSVVNIFVALQVVFYAILLTGHSNQGITGVFFAFAIANYTGFVAVLLVARPLTFRRVFSVNGIKHLTLMLSYSVPLVPNVVAYWFATLGMRSLIVIFLGLAANGLFSAAARVSSLVMVIFGVFNLAFQPSAIEARSQGPSEPFFAKVFLRLIRGLFACGCIFVWIGWLLFRFVLNEAFQGGLSYVPGLVFCAILMTIGQYLGNILIADRRTSAMAVSMLFTSVIGFLLAAILISILGVHGAILGMATGNLLLVLCRYRMVGLQLFRRRTIVWTSVALGFFLLSGISTVWSAFDSAGVFPFTGIALGTLLLSPDLRSVSKLLQGRAA